MTIDHLNTYSTIAQNFVVIGGFVVTLYHFLKKSDILHSVKKSLKSLHCQTSNPKKVYLFNFC